MAEDEDREMPTKLPVLPKKEGGILYGTYLYVQRLKYSTYVRTCTRNCIPSVEPVLLYGTEVWYPGTTRPLWNQPSKDRLSSIGHLLWRMNKAIDQSM
ncbi:hypothetical protein EDB81DRAFT_354904 [Dactylonectria macrodidyma]|uniref:Uncharacterized protein n=1 Tax=Dactylonectria macrodidyma TaxID=307937 RepID=A0A9P9I960_9HYPO|nr:hypothetical protein EDB81DRAFT_354904 [Dactylonectria macrodidyma]